MHRHYIGIITQRGLEALVPETDDTLRFFRQWLGSRSECLGICYWFDMDDQAANELDQHLRCGYTREAWHALQAHVRFAGPVMPTMGHSPLNGGDPDDVALN